MKDESFVSPTRERVGKCIPSLARALLLFDSGKAHFVSRWAKAKAFQGLNAPFISQTIMKMGLLTKTMGSIPQRM